jgi:hypothetical protein
VRFASGTYQESGALSAMKSWDVTAIDTRALSRVNLTYLWRHGRLPNLQDPTRFTELIQLRKLLDRDANMPLMADKVGVKRVVASRLGQEWVLPILWSGNELSPLCAWSQPVMLKSRHGCKQNLVVGGGQSSWGRASALAAKWMSKPYGTWLDEWLYTEIPRGLLIEPYIGSGHQLPTDYKVYVFGGKATHVQTHLNRASQHLWVVHDANWKALSPAGELIKPPSALSAMLAAAEELARGFHFVRIDFYQPDIQPLLGEMTFYPGSGLDRFDPPSLDSEMGQLWLDAIKSREADSGASSTGKSWSDAIFNETRDVHGKPKLLDTLVA